jgi:hypothetical protein
MNDVTLWTRLHLFKVELASCRPLGEIAKRPEKSQKSRKTNKKGQPRAGLS